MTLKARKSWTVKLEYSVYQKWGKAQLYIAMYTMNSLQTLLEEKQYPLQFLKLKSLLGFGRRSVSI